MATIVHIVSRLNTGGLALNVIGLCHELSKLNGNKVILISGRIEEGSGEGSMENLADVYGVDTIYIDELKRSINPKNDYAAYRKIKALLNDLQPDVVHTHSSKAGLIGRLAAKKNKVKKIFHTYHGHVLHSYFGKLKSKVFQLIEQGLAKLTTIIIVLSEQQKDELLNEFHIGKNSQYKVIPLGLNLSSFLTDTANKRTKFRESFKIAEDTIAIGMIGRLTAIKNPTMALESFKAVKDLTNQRIQLYLVGDGELKHKLFETCTQLNLTYSTKENLDSTADVIFTSWMSNIDEINAGMDIIVLTSLNEGTPVSIIESKVSKRPVVSTNVGGVEDIITHGKTGFLVEPNDVEEFTNYLLKLVNNKTLRKTLGGEGSQEIFNRYNMHSVALQIQTFYNHTYNEQ